MFLLVIYPNLPPIHYWLEKIDRHLEQIHT